MTTERLSVFDMLRIGVGPSSSHTLGPWRAMSRFLSDLPIDTLGKVSHIAIDLYGSLAKTGRGHGTDIAIQLGLVGADPETVDVDTIPSLIEQIAGSRSLQLLGRRRLEFDPQADIVFHHTESLPLHPNALRITASTEDGVALAAVYYSVGGGFVVCEGDVTAASEVVLPFPIETAADLIAHCATVGGHMSDVVRCNERSWRSDAEIDSRLQRIADVMTDCVHRGCRHEGILPGGLSVRRRAAGLAHDLLRGPAPASLGDFLGAIRSGAPSFQRILDWVSCFAIAVNEENAAFGRVVTAPTNGAAGVIPAVLLYTQLFNSVPADATFRFLLTAGEIGCLFKKGATISAALGGCQAEIGVSSSMAAAALAEALGGTPEQSAIAAEIAMEHHLGLTCDPVGGLVQIPCIERNAVGAVTAIAAAQMALRRRPGEARVSLDNVIRTMWETALDMNGKYKETSEGGLAVQIPVAASEC